MSATFCAIDENHARASSIVTFLLRLRGWFWGGLLRRGGFRCGEIQRTDGDAASSRRKYCGFCYTV